ncbi:hypothetical protein IG631_06355 [Alternaria alternata]|nr:hypothetical protein IG631_06355 [Alternaria alternata]
MEKPSIARVDDTQVMVTLAAWESRGPTAMPVTCDSTPFERAQQLSCWTALRDTGLSHTSAHHAGA